MGLLLIGMVLINIPFMLYGKMFNAFAAGVCTSAAVWEIMQNGLIG